MKGFFSGMGAYLMAGVVIALVNMGIWGSSTPTWVFWTEALGVSALITIARAAEKERQERKAQALELRKHLMTLQFGRMEPPHDPTRLGQEMLRAFEKREVGNGQPVNT